MILAKSHTQWNLSCLRDNTQVAHHTLQIGIMLIYLIDLD